MGSRCMAYNLRAAMELSDADKVDFFVKDDGTKPTVAEVNRQIMLAYNQGFEVLPPCGNVNDLGHCKGHAE